MFKRVCAVLLAIVLLLSVLSVGVVAAKFYPSESVAHGIDVSAHQGYINWDSVKASGKADFAIIRCGYGQDMTSQDDEYFRRNVQECQRVGIPFGLYLYSYTTTVSGASGEADHCIRLINECKSYSMFQLPMYYDLEEGSAYALSNSTLLSIAQTFHDKIESTTGITVGIYANTNWFNNKLTDSWYQQQPLWCAQYYSSCQYAGDYDLWQYSSSGSVSGISGNVDMNYSRVPVSQISGGTSNPSTPSTPSTPGEFHSNQLLQNGSSGEQVRYLQYALKTFGYYTMNVDGDYGSGTAAAVTAYQSAKGLSADGMAGSTTLGEIIFEAKWLQRNLRALGYYNGEIDGILDDDVTNAIKNFQSANGLTSDGIATASVLETISNIGKNVQTILQFLGYYTSTIDGQLGEGTVTAIKAFQTAKGLSVSGAYDSATDSAANREIMWLQRNLSCMGYYTGAINSSPDSATVSAVKSFQSANGLTADGVANTTTLNAIADKGAYYQSSLKTLGYYSDGIDGQLGDNTVTAVKAFQTAEKLNASGVIDGTTSALIAKRLQGLSSAGAAQKPDENVTYKWMWANDENNTILTKYNYTSGDHLGGGHYGGDNQKVGEMRKYGFVDRCQTLNVTYMIYAPEKGKYSAYLTYIVGNLTAGEPYTMVVGVNDKTFYESTRGLVGDGTNRRWVECDLFTLDLEKGVNIVRILPAAADNYSNDVYVDFNALLIDNRCTCVTSQYKSAVTALSPVGSEHINKYEVSGEILTNADNEQSAFDNVNYYSLNNENLSKVPYYSYTFEAPYDGYYNIYQSHTSANNSDNGIGRIAYAVDGRFYDASIKLCGGLSEVYLTPYMTKGRHTITVTNVFEYEGTYGGQEYHGKADIKDLKVGKLTVYGAVKSDVQLDPEGYTPNDRIYYADNSAHYTRGQIAVNELTYGDTTHRQIGAFKNNPITLSDIQRGYYNADYAEYVTYNIRAERAGEYDITSVFQLAPSAMNCGSTGYFITVVVNDEVTYRGSTFEYYFRGTPDCADARGVSSAKVTLKEGINVVRFFVHTKDCWTNIGTGWVDFEYIRVSGVGDTSIHTSYSTGKNTIPCEVAKAGDSDLVNRYLTVTPGGGIGYVQYGDAFAQTVTFDNLSTDNLQYVPYFAYGITAPEAGYYDLKLLAKYGPEGKTTNGNAYVAVMVNGTKYKRNIHSINEYSVYNISVWLPKGESVIYITPPLTDHFTSTAQWFDIAEILSYGGASFSYVNDRVASPVIENVDGNTVLLKAQDGFEYSIDGINWQSSTRFEGLKPDKRYSLYQRKADDGKSRSVALDYAIVSAPEIMLIGATKVLVKPIEGYEYSTDGVNWQRSNMLEILNPDSDYTVYQRLSGSNVYSVVSQGVSVNTYGSDEVNTSPTAEELVSVRKEVMASGKDMSCDYNGDGQISLLDLMRLKLFMAGADVPLGASVG